MRRIPFFVPKADVLLVFPMGLIVVFGLCVLTCDSSLTPRGSYFLFLPQCLVHGVAHSEPSAEPIEELTKLVEEMVLA